MYTRQPRRAVDSEAEFWEEKASKGSRASNNSSSILAALVSPRQKEKAEYPHALQLHDKTKRGLFARSLSRKQVREFTYGKKKKKSGSSIVRAGRADSSPVILKPRSGSMDEKLKQEWETVLALIRGAVAADKKDIEDKASQASDSASTVPVTLEDDGGDDESASDDSSQTDVQLKDISKDWATQRRLALPELPRPPLLVLNDLTSSGLQESNDVEGSAGAVPSGIQITSPRGEFAEEMFRKHLDLTSDIHRTTTDAFKMTLKELERVRALFAEEIEKNKQLSDKIGVLYEENHALLKRLAIPFQQSETVVSEL